MSGADGPTYDRAPSRQLRDLLATDGFLAPLLVRRTVAGVRLEVHLRPADEVHLYCGLTCLVKSGRDRGGSIRIESHRRYAGQQCARGLFRPGRTRKIDQGRYLRDVWTVGERGFEGALDDFLNDVVVAPRQTKEGGVQSRWSRIGAPWIPFDKEVALAYPSISERRRHLAALFRESVEEARDESTALAWQRRSLPSRREHWALPPEPKDSLKLDQIAVDPAGNLVLLEIKDAASRSSSEVYYAPFQLLQNVWEWHFALEAVRGSLQELLDVRVELGMTRAGARPVTGSVRAAVGFGDDERNEEVRQRYVQVLRIANAHLPRGVPAIETWMLVNDHSPVRLD